MKWNKRVNIPVFSRVRREISPRALDIRSSFLVIPHILGLVLLQLCAVGLPVLRSLERRSELLRGPGLRCKACSRNSGVWICDSNQEISSRLTIGGFISVMVSVISNVLGRKNAPKIQKVLFRFFGWAKIRHLALVYHAYFVE